MRENDNPMYLARFFILKLSKVACVGITCFLIGSCNSKSSDDYLSKREAYGNTIQQFLTNETTSKEQKLSFLRKKTQEIRNTKELESTELYRDISEGFKNIKAYNDCQIIASHLIRFGKRTKDTFALALAHHNRAIYYSRVTKQMDSAYIHYFNASKFYQVVDSTTLAGKVQLSMAILQKNVGDFIGSEASSVRALKLLASEDDVRYAASAYNNLGLVARHLDKPEEALTYFDKVINYRKKVSDNALLQAGTYNNIGIVYLNMQAYEQAILWYNKGLAIDSLKELRPSTYARLLGNKGYALFKNGAREQALKNSLHAYRIRDSIRDWIGKSSSALYLGEFYAAQNDTAVAQKYFQEARAYSEQTNYNTGRLRSLKWLSEITPSDQAITYAQEHIKLNDSLVKEERAFQDHFARVRYETDALKVEKSKAEEQSKWLMIAFLCVTILFLFGYILKERATNKRKRRFLEEKQLDTEEIYGLMLAQQTKIEEGKKIEKDRISRELHDGVLSRLFGIRLSLDTLNAGVEESYIQSRANYLEELKELGQEIRQISHDLQKDQFNTESSYPETIRDMIRKYCEETNMQFTFHNEPAIPWEDVPNTKKVNLYRILQEGMTNSLRHGKATCIQVLFQLKGDVLIMKLADNGKGLGSKRKQTGIGIRNIKYRVGELGGDFILRNRKEKGAELVVSFLT